MLSGDSAGDSAGDSVGVVWRQCWDLIDISVWCCMWGWGGGGVDSTKTDWLVKHCGK